MSENTEPIPAAQPPAVLPYEPTPAPATSGPKSWEIRLWSGFIFALAAILLAIGLYLTPDPHGMGTHQKLGLPPCGLVQMTGYPCPTCGCTTAVSLAAHGHFLLAIYTQPFGAFVGLLAWACLILGFIGLTTAKWLGPSPFFLQWHLTRILLLILALLLAAWVYKIILVRYFPS